MLFYPSFRDKLIFFTFFHNLIVQAKPAKTAKTAKIRNGMPECISEKNPKQKGKHIDRNK